MDIAESEGLEKTLPAKSGSGLLLFSNSKETLNPSLVIESELL